MKKFIVVLLAVSALFGVQASELWWQIVAVDEDGNDITDWESATVYYAKDGKTTSLATVSKDALQILDYAVATVDSTMSGGSFYAEIYNSSTTYTSDDVSYETLNSENAIYAGGTSYGATPYEFTDFSTVPEPTSGLLMLLGFAALGLKRRKA